jgi:fucose permease
MAQWCSGYLEAALNIPKLLGDVFGVALFSLMLGLGRTLYAKFGKNIYPVLFFCAVGATACYFTAAASSLAIVGLIACALTGFFTSMLWPGNLIAATDRFPTGGVLIYALMASGGDLGASVGPQLVGIITDWAIASDTVTDLAAGIGLSSEQLGMKLGMLVGMIFPLIAIAIFAVMWRGKCKRSKAQANEQQ